jgi:hypothetical protein
MEKLKETERLRIDVLWGACEESGMTNEDKVHAERKERERNKKVNPLF